MSKKRSFLFVLSLLLAVSAANAQERVRNLSDLEGSKVGDGMREMRSRGYTYLWNDVSGRDQYELFRESRSDRCVSVHVRDGRYESLVYVPESDCDRHSSSNRSSYNSGGSTRDLNDLVGARGGDGEYQLQQRGYRLDHVDKSSRGITQYWSKRGDCYRAELYDGRYDSFRTTSSRDCRDGDSSSRRYSGGGNRNVDYPRVNVDTAGRGNYNGPGFNEPRIDRGYVDTTSSRVKIGMSVKSGFRIMLYGRITRQAGDREFEMDIEDSDDGRASGRGRFRFNKDRNEVEMIDFDARIRGDRVSGRFNRS